MQDNNYEPLAQKVAQYKPSPRALAGANQVPLLLMAGITAAGKDTLLCRLTALHPDSYRFATSHTTRAKRENNGIMEQDGDPYYFIDKAAAIRMLNEKAFVEVNLFASNIYGTSIAEIEQAGESGKILVNDVDVNGVANFVRLGLNVKPVFLLPPDFETWWQRLRARYEGSFNAADLRKRLHTALAELENAIQHDYFYMVVNDDLDQAVTQVDDIAHGRQVEARNPTALGIARELAARIPAELDNLT